MTEDILRMAREAGLVREWMDLCKRDEEALDRFAALVRADEREACAKVCDKWHRIAQQYETSHRTHSYIMGKGAAICAHNIRARKP